MGILKRGRLGLLSLVIAILGLLMAPGALAQTTTCAGDYDVTVGAVLMNPNSGFGSSEATVALTTPIPAGDYTLAMVSHDDHTSKYDQYAQTNEQWYLQLLDAAGAIVYQSGVSPDLPDAQDWLTFNATATLTGDAVTLRAVHAAIGNNINSVIAHCAAFTAVAPELGSIGDTVWLDTDGNGWMNGSEAGIAGIDVGLAGPVVGSTTTDANGAYGFTGLPAGTYVVTVGTGPAGSVLSTVGSFTVPLAEGENHVDADFGFVPVVVEPEFGSIGDTVWLDADGNGWRNGSEAGIAGVRVFLTVPGTAGAIETTTDANGNYLFSNLAAGNYDVTVDITTAPADTTLTTVGAFTVSLAAGEGFKDADFGFNGGGVLATAAIGDQVWMDDNLNGIFDSGEDVLAGVTVSILDTVNETTQTTVTGASGQYLFAALIPGTYEVSVVSTTAPENTSLTTAGMYAITLSEGQTTLIADFGFAQSLPNTGFETADFGIAGLVLLLIGAAALVLVRPASRTPWHLVNANEVQ
jgi:LPXTG-motif cell wall-anchored protein